MSKFKPSYTLVIAVVITFIGVIIGIIPLNNSGSLVNQYSSGLATLCGGMIGGVGSLVSFALLIRDLRDHNKRVRRAFCSNCGESIENVNDKYCRGCGLLLGETMGRFREENS